MAQSWTETALTITSVCSACPEVEEHMLDVHVGDILPNLFPPEGWSIFRNGSEWVLLCPKHHLIVRSLQEVGP